MNKTESNRERMKNDSEKCTQYIYLNKPVPCLQRKIEKKKTNKTVKRIEVRVEIKDRKGSNGV